MLVRLYALEGEPGMLSRLAASGVVCRRAESFERHAILVFVRERWPNWVDETIAAFAQAPPTLFVAQRDQALLGFAAYNATRPNYFGPTGVEEAERGKGI